MGNYHGLHVYNILKDYLPAYCEDCRVYAHILWLSMLA